MIKAVVFVDGPVEFGCHYRQLNHLEFDSAVCFYIDAGKGYSECMSLLKDCLFNSAEMVVVTNSLEVFNDSSLKESVTLQGNSSALNRFYLIDREGKLRNLQDLTDKELHTYHNLQKLYVNNGFEKLED